MTEERRKNCFKEEDRRLLYGIEATLGLIEENAREARESFLDHEHRIAKVEAKTLITDHHEGRLQKAEGALTKLAAVWSTVAFLLGLVGALIGDIFWGLFSGRHQK